MNFPLGIEKLLQLMKDNKIFQVKLKHEDQEIEIRRKRNLNSNTELIKNEDSSNNVEDNSNYIISEHIGVYFESEKSIDEGSTVKKDQVLGYVETGNIKYPIKAENNCVIKKILVEHNEIVEYGSKLFIINGES